MKYRLLFVLLVFFASCSDEKQVSVPRNLIQPDEMVVILVDYHLAEAALTEEKLKNSDMNLFTNHYYNGILRNHGISRKKFALSIKFYAANVSELQKIYERVVNELTTMQVQTISNKP